MSLISIRRREKAVELLFDVGADENGHAFETNLLLFTWSTNDVMFAALLTERIRNQMRDTIRKIRKEAYEEGWRDAKGKKVAKRVVFFGNLP